MQKDAGSNAYTAPVKPREKPPITPRTAPESKVYEGGASSIGAVRNQLTVVERRTIYDQDGVNAALLAARYQLHEAVRILEGENFVSARQAKAADESVGNFEAVIEGINRLIRLTSGTASTVRKISSRL